MTLRVAIRLKDGGPYGRKHQGEGRLCGDAEHGTLIAPHFFCSYIWQHIETGYVQGMCDLLAPLLVILDDGECVLPDL